MEKEETTQESNPTQAESNATPADTQKEQPKKEKRVINETEDKKLIIQGKQEGDKQIQIDAKQAIRVYQKTLETVIDIKNDYEGDKASEFYKFILDHELKITSNLALCNVKLKNYEKAIEYDLIIINQLDKLFDKSYVRLMKSYMEIKEMMNAFNYYRLMIGHFSKETINKYKDAVDDFLKKANEDEKLSKLIKGKKGVANKSNRIIYIVLLIVLMVIGVLLYNNFASNSSIIEAPVAPEIRENKVVEEEIIDLQQTEGAEDL